MKILVVVDMQNDFITGALGSAEAQAVVPKVKGYIEQWLEEKKGSLYFTRDTHHDNYMISTRSKKSVELRVSLLRATSIS